MTYTYTALLYHLDKETIFTFTSLPSGILSIDKNEDEKEAVEEVLMELLSDEEFLPRDMLPTDVVPTEEEKKEWSNLSFLFLMMKRKQESSLFQSMTNRGDYEYA